MQMSRWLPDLLPRQQRNQLYVQKTQLLVLPWEGSGPTGSLVTHHRNQFLSRKGVNLKEMGWFTDWTRKLKN